MQLVITDSSDWNASDTSGKDAFKDVSLTVNVRQLVGEYKAPVGSKATVGGAKCFVELFDDTTTAVREDGEIQFMAVSNATGQEKLITTISTRVLAASGQISVPSEWNYLPVGSVAGDAIRMYFKSAATDILDSTDHNWIMPVTLL